MCTARNGVVQVSAKDCTATCDVQICAVYLEVVRTNNEAMSAPILLPLASNKLLTPSAIADALRRRLSRVHIHIKDALQNPSLHVFESADCSLRYMKHICLLGPPSLFVSPS